MKKAILIQYYGKDKYSDNKYIDELKTYIMLVKENGDSENIFDISEVDQHDHYFNRDFEGLNLLGREIFKIYQENEIIGVIDTDNEDLMSKSYSELKKLL